MIRTTKKSVGTREVFKNLLCLFAAVIIFIVILESVVRATETEERTQPYGPFGVVDYRSTNDSRKYEMIPNQEKQWSGEWFRNKIIMEVKINSLGLRDDELRNDSLKIIVLGDSVAFGPGVDQKDIYAALLEKKLRYYNDKMEVVNAAVVGYDTMQEYTLLKKLSYLQPKMVILNFVTNDILGDDFNVTDKTVFTIKMKKKQVPTFLPLPENVNLFLVTKFHSFRFLNEKLYNLMSQLDFINQDSVKFYNPVELDQADKVRKAIGDINNLCSQDCKLMIVVTPNTYQEWKDYDARWHEWIRQVAFDYNITLIDTLETFKNYSLDEIRIDDVTHLNKKGHEIVANVLEEEIMGKNLI